MPKSPNSFKKIFWFTNAKLKIKMTNEWRTISNLDHMYVTQCKTQYHSYRFVVRLMSK